MTPPQIITSAGAILTRYKVLLCDVWGVVHNGAAAHDKACDALIKFRTLGGTVILVSNAPVPKFRVEAMLARVGVPPNICDDIVSSGDIALNHIRDVGYKQVFYIGPKDRDAAFFEQSSASSAPMKSAEAVVCTGLNDDRNETAEDYRPVLEEALKKNLPFVCANPDLVVDVGGTHFVCAGAIGDLYERMGGAVFWAGKPFASAYDKAMALAVTLRGGAVAKSDALVIGDAIRTDIEGARRYGVEALFVAGGIHRQDVVMGDMIRPEKLTALFKEKTPPALAAMVELTW